MAFRLPSGRLAGSSLTLDRGLRNICEMGAMTLLEAVAACTLLPARLLGIESQRGTLRVGARADFAILEADPLETPPEQLKDIGILGTMFEGTHYPIDA